MNVLIRHVKFYTCNTNINGDILVNKKINFHVPDFLTTQLLNQSLYDSYLQIAFVFGYLMI